jgi:hypothetical protein
MTNWILVLNLATTHLVGGYNEEACKRQAAEAQKAQVVAFCIQKPAERSVENIKSGATYPAPAPRVRPSPLKPPWKVKNGPPAQNR